MLFLSVILLLLFSSLAIHIGVVNAQLADQSPDLKHPQNQCGVRAWVRAPDLVPGQIIEGDARIKLEGDCPEVESYSLGLRYKERVFWEIRKSDMPPTEWNTYEDAEQAPEKWVHEEERLGFETKWPFAAEQHSGPGPRVFVQEFSLLVPYTNYPPGVDLNTGAHDTSRSVINVESIYEYFAEIRGTNGTRKEVQAGMTSFTPLIPAEISGGASFNITLENDQPREIAHDPLGSNYTLEIRLPEFFQGTTTDASVIISRSGYTNRTDKPISICPSPSSSPTPAFTKPHIEGYRYGILHKFNTQLSALHPERDYRKSLYHECTPVTFPDGVSHGADHGVLAVTTSAPISVPVSIDHYMPIDFKSYYQSYEGLLWLDLQVTRDPAEPLTEEEQRWVIPLTSLYEKDDYDWLSSDPFSPTRHLRGNTTISIQPHPALGGCSTAQQPPVHYLSTNARAPVFIDPQMHPLRFHVSLSPPKEKRNSTGTSLLQRTTHSNGSSPIAVKQLANALTPRLAWPQPQNG
ncbi:hypothetical protein HYDPIDRAFT_41307 [Hydnomerulius pinastri MD-312]|uniref:Arrestin-like N-terminal domain-containing protein n=1 Tax=Hydnomerulius pinastri MD-312 TaxID=994086 RepID=A0A0C9WDH4_9AGAM|nr:hypothetical protein HYDPIDRAFT_41307 [Hydnomerulius pinastri MD-312]